MDLAGIGSKGCAARPPYSILFASDHKPVKMSVAPIEGNLEDVMKIGDCAGAERTRILRQTGGLTPRKRKWS
jgi:hypothetical protein